MREVVAGHKRRIAARLAEERVALRALPSTAIPSYTVFHARVRKGKATHDLRTEAALRAEAAGAI
ncbi:MAG TPA: hypothetical protein VHN14_09625 [Kofleriaceae bacterium]|nr:hypothetical protein [Kofleriaceae bacterium]